MSEWAHATAVLAGRHGVLIRGASGSGKSLLAAMMIAGGARLIADDRVHLSACHGRIVAAAPSATASMLELRGRGIVAAPRERSALIRLVVDMADEAGLERYPEAERLETTLLSVRLPCQPVPAASAQALVLVAAALKGL
jgi:HPr kinase/phosphorylase